MLIFLLKELFQNYITNGSCMYVSMLDAYKAFDKVNHSKLFGKLIDRDCATFIVGFLNHWYSTQTFTIRWCQGFSSFYTVSNGVKQGGILSPHLFNVYIHGWRKCKSQQITNWLSLCRHLNQPLDVCWWPMTSVFFLPVLPVWENLQIAVPSMTNYLILKTNYL